MTIAWNLKNLFGEKFQFKLVEKMLQNTQAASSLFNSPQAFSTTPVWLPEIAAFRIERQKYLLYQ